MSQKAYFSIASSPGPFLAFQCYTETLKDRWEPGDEANFSTLFYIAGLFNPSYRVYFKADVFVPQNGHLPPLE